LFSGFHGNVTLNAGSGQFYTFLGSCSIAKSFFQTTVEGVSNSEFFYTDTRDLVQFKNGIGFDTYVFQTLEVQHLSIDNRSGNSTTRIESPLITLGNLVVSAGTGFDNLTIHNAAVTGDVIGYFFDGGSDVRFDDAAIEGLTDIFTTEETDYISVIDSEFVGPLYVNTNEGDDIFIVTGSWFHTSFVGDAGAGFETLSISLDNVFWGFFELSGIEQEWTLECVLHGTRSMISNACLRFMNRFCGRAKMAKHDAL
jgi:hypothetical protein